MGKQGKSTVASAWRDSGLSWAEFLPSATEVDQFVADNSVEWTLTSAAPAATSITSSEDLRYDSVIAVNKGIYDVVLQGEDGQTKAKSELVALDKESYVILRTGVEAQMGPAYPQELVIYPKSDR